MGWWGGVVAYVILVSPPVPIGLGFFISLGLRLGLGLGGQGLGLGLDNIISGIIDIINFKYF